MAKYLGPTLGKRKIGLAITQAGLDSFHLDLYIFPSDLLQKKNSGNAADKATSSLYFSKVKQLTLALEQIFLLLKNPEYNVLKVAGSPAGLKRTPESMVNNFLINSKPLFDTVNQELIYKTPSQNKFGLALGISVSNIRGYFSNGQLYLSRFLFSYTALNSPP